MHKMHSLKSLLGRHATLLLLDASSAQVQVGVWEAKGPPRWASSAKESAVGLFECLEQLSCDPLSPQAFAFCEGPGSILGIRTSAAAIRAWCVLKARPVYAYIGLALVAEAIGDPEVSVVADARRGHWHCQRLGRPLLRVARSELAGRIASPEGFRHWEALPEATERVSYDLEKLLAQPAVAQAALMRETAEPEAFLHQEPTYATWEPQIHRAP